MVWLAKSSGLILGDKLYVRSMSHQIFIFSFHSLFYGIVEFDLQKMAFQAASSCLYGNLEEQVIIE